MKRQQPHHHHQPLWEAFAQTEQTKHHFHNNVKERMTHVLRSLRYASHLCSSVQRFDLALALVRAAETHITWLWETEKTEGVNQFVRESIMSSSRREGDANDDEDENEDESSSFERRRHFVTSLRNASTAAIRLRTLCESKIMASSRISTTTASAGNNAGMLSNLWLKSRQRLLRKIQSGTAEDYSLIYDFNDNNHDGEPDQDDLFWILSELQQHLSTKARKNNSASAGNLQDRRTRELLLKKLESGVTHLLQKRNQEEQEEGSRHYASEIVDSTFFAQALLTLGVFYSSFHYLVGSLDEIRRVLKIIEENGQRSNNHQLEKIAASCACEISKQILDSFSSAEDDDEEEHNGDAESDDGDDDDPNTKQEVKFVKKLQTLILLIEMISTLCKSLERKDHTSSPNTDLLLIELYSLWVRLSEEVSLLVEYGFVKGRGQSRIRGGGEFSNWLKKYRFEVKDFDYSSQNQTQSSNTARKKKRNDDESNQESMIIVEDWFDIMRNRIRMLKIAREQ